MPNRTCSINGCTRPHKGHGWCATHLLRWKTHGDPHKGAMKPANTSPCIIGECERVGRTKGMCTKHYERVKANGSPHDKDQAFIPGVYKECIFCSGPIPTNGRLRRYCSGGCATAYSLGESRPQPRPCAQCGVVIDFRVRLASGRLRSKRSRLCVRCVPPSNMRKHIPALVQRDGHDCGICSKPVDLALKFPHSMSFSIDHVIPRSHGGPNVLENYRLAHLGCNSRRKDALDFAA